jgi:hypothetical protein
MAVSGAAVAYAVAGSLIFYSGLKGASLAATVKAVLSGNLSLSNTQTIGSPVLTVSGTGSGSTSAAVSGSGTANELTAAEYLVSNGYSNAAAAGIVACIAGESGGNPETSGDGGTSFGLIQEHGSQYAPLVTGNATKDLDAQLPAIIAYNNAQGAGLVSMLNSIADPVQAADFYSQNFERPKVTDSDVVSSVATSVYSQLGKGG